jgi:hypothetical protein
MASSTDNLVQPPDKLPGASAAATRQVPPRERQAGTGPRGRRKPKPPKPAEADGQDAQSVQGGPDEEHQVNYLA